MINTDKQSFNRSYTPDICERSISIFSPGWIPFNGVAAETPPGDVISHKADIQSEQAGGFGG